MTELEVRPHPDAEAAKDLIRQRAAEDDPAKMAAIESKLLRLIPDLIFELDEAWWWTAAMRKHQEDVAARSRQHQQRADQHQQRAERAEALLQVVRDHVGLPGDGEIDAYSLRRALYGHPDA